MKYFLDKYRYIETDNSPWCPECGARMKLRIPKAGQDWKPFWGCNRYPDCTGAKQPDILDDRYKQEKLF